MIVLLIWERNYKNSIRSLTKNVVYFYHNFTLFTNNFIHYLLINKILETWKIQQKEQRIHLGICLP